MRETYSDIFSRCAHILSEETKDMGSIGFCLNLFSKKKNIYIYTYIYIYIYIYKSLMADIRSETTTTTESKYFVLNKLFLEFPCL